MYRSIQSPLLISSILLLVALSAEPQAAAQMCQQEPQCNALLESGQSASKEQKYDRALKVFEAAYALTPDPVLLINIGRAHYRLGHPDKAIENYLRFQGAVPNPDPQIAETVERYLAEARAAEAKSKVATESRPKKPIYKQWWLWTAVGVVVAGAAIGTGLAVYAKKPDAPLSFEPFKN